MNDFEVPPTWQASPVSFAWQSDVEYLKASSEGDVFDPELQQRVLDRREKVGKRVGHFSDQPIADNNRRFARP